jgi:phosphatase NudJ
MFVLGVIRDQERYLVVQERDGTWYLPAGRVEEGENLMAALVRETLEEAAQLIAIDGLLGMDHAWHPDPARTRVRFVFAGARAILAPPKDAPDEHSLRAAWLTKAEIRLLPLRHVEVLDWIERWETRQALLPCAAYEWFGPHGGAHAVTARSGRGAA